MWYVDDSKVLQEDSEVVTQVLNRLKKRFDKMTIKRGKTHNFVGMDIMYNEDGTVSLSMKDYILECLETFGKIYNKGTTSLAKINVFEIDEKAERRFSKG